MNVLKESSFDKKKNVVFVIEFADMTGGMLHSVYSLVSKISEHSNYRVTIICPYGDVYNSFSSLDVDVLGHGTEKWSVKKPTEFIRCLLYLRSVMIKFGDNSIFVTNNILAQFMVSSCSIRKLVKLVYYNRGGNLDNTVSRLVRFFGYKIDVLLATSNSQLNIVRSASVVNPSRLKLLHNPVELTETCDKKMSRTNGIDTFVIGVVGYIDVGKNQILAVQSLKVLVDSGINAKLKIYGASNNKDYLLALENTIESLGLHERVEICGFEKNKGEIYSSIDLLLSTSISEGFGRTLVEAMLYKKPVIALRCAGGPVDILKDNLYGILSDNNPHDVATAIGLFTDENFRNETVDRAYKYALSEYSSEKISERFLNILDNIK